MTGLNLPRSQMLDILIHMIAAHPEAFQTMLVAALPDEFERLTDPDRRRDVAADTLQRLVGELYQLKSGTDGA